MNNLAHARRGGRVEHDASVRNRRVERLSAVRKPDPVGIEERASAFKTSLQFVAAIEIERHRFNLIAKWIRSRRMPRKRPDSSPARQQNARNVVPRISSRTGN